MILKKFPRPPGGSRAEPGDRSGRHRNLVRRRGPHRPKEQDHTALGQARHTASRTAGPAHPLDLHFRRHLPQARQGSSSRPAPLQHGGDEPSSCGDRGIRGTRRPRRAPPRPGRMASVRKARRAAEHHHHPAAAQVPGTQSDRPEGQRQQKCLAVHAAAAGNARRAVTLALEPCVPVLHQHPRSLLSRLEQTRRATLDHHVHRIEGLGSQVLISGIWY